MLEFYRHKIRRTWRWRVRHSNGNNLANGGQGYSRRIDAEQGLVGALKIILRSGTPGVETAVIDWLYERGIELMPKSDQ